MPSRRSSRLAAVIAASGALTLLSAAGAIAAPAQPAGQGSAAQIGRQPDTGISPLCLIMIRTKGCEHGPIQK